jgi:hypothetical protein
MPPRAKTSPRTRAGPRRPGARRGPGRTANPECSQVRTCDPAGAPLVTTRDRGGSIGRSVLGHAGQVDHPPERSDPRRAPARRRRHPEAVGGGARMGVARSSEAGLLHVRRGRNRLPRRSGPQRCTTPALDRACRSCTACRAAACRRRSEPARISPLHRAQRKPLSGQRWDLPRGIPPLRAVEPTSIACGSRTPRAYLQHGCQHPEGASGLG